MNHFTRTSIVSIFFYIEFNERKKKQNFVEETKAKAKVISIFQKLTRTPLQSYAQKKIPTFSTRKRKQNIQERERERERKARLNIADYDIQNENRQHHLYLSKFDIVEA